MDPIAKPIGYRDVIPMPEARDRVQHYLDTTNLEPIRGVVVRYRASDTGGIYTAVDDVWIGSWEHYGEDEIEIRIDR
jgi:hypothetical protein